MITVMCIERFYLSSAGEHPRHLLFIDINDLIFDGEPSLCSWTASWELSDEKSINVLSQALDIKFTRAQREPIVSRAFDIIKCLPEIEYSYVPDHLLKDGRYCSKLESFYKQCEDQITKHPSRFIKLNEPYSEGIGQNTLAFRVISHELSIKLNRLRVERVIFPVSQSVFEKALDDSIMLQKCYVEYFSKSNLYFNLIYYFSEVGLTETWFLVQNYKIVFLFFTKPSKELINHFTLK